MRIAPGPASTPTLVRADVDAPGHGFGRHGGRLADAMRRWPEAPQPWLDLSTGINPRPYPAPRGARRAWTRLPDPDELAALERAAAAAFGTAAERVCATAGAEAALRLLPCLLGAQRVAIAAPTYGGHADAWRAHGAEVTTCTGEALVLGDGPEAEVQVIVNPNNPDGAVAHPEALLALADGLAAQGRWLVVDESFVEAAPELSVSSHAGGRLVVLRSFGKFYGLPGLRLGFLLGAPELVAALRARLGDWPVSSNAITAGRRAYADPEWAARSRARLARDADRFDRLLHRAGFTDVCGTTLFRYAQAPDALRRFEVLAARGVLTRPFAYAPDRLRFGLPPPGTWDRIEAALQESADER